jgi:predicted Fe-Mo cluster-binding NifX family protein
MKVVITCKGKTLEALADQRFGRCPVFLLVDTDTHHVEALPNEASYRSAGAGIRAAKLLTHQEVDAVITGNLGPNVVRFLEAEGISVYLGARGSARQALKQYDSGRLRRAPATPGGRSRGDRITGRHRNRGATLPGKGRGAYTGDEGGDSEGKEAGFPPTSGIHAGAEPSVPDDEMDSE